MRQAEGVDETQERFKLVESAFQAMLKPKYVPCEVMKQRMQVQGTTASRSPLALKDNAPVKPGGQMYGYYTGMFHAGRSIWMEQGLRGLFAGYMSTLARDVPFAGLMVMFYEALKDITSYGKQKWAPNSNYSISSSFEGLLLGGLAGGKFCKLDSVTSNGLSLHDLQI
ncbi:hypothetical protein CDL15_Pgr013348 [Punica granatum]|uniref:Uncharacterized protein n=1 Tax=Punica granatum TaxID=22663 RepID=A0A218WNN5_PUNGR|nr:hypothetical protein CDL15_Pgr013348 [Punica granatum]